MLRIFDAAHVNIIGDRQSEVSLELTAQVRFAVGKPLSQLIRGDVFGEVLFNVVKQRAETVICAGKEIGAAHMMLHQIRDK